MRSEGGKAPGSAGARGVLQAFEALGGEPLSPLANRVAITVEFVGNLLVGGLVRVGRPQNDAAAEGQCLGC